MRLFLYHEGLCQPEKGIGHARQFDSSDDLDAFLHFFVVSIKEDVLYRWRAFITNDDVDWAAVDHFALFGEPIHIITRYSGKIEEVELPALWRDLTGKLDKKKRAELIRKQLVE
jgi:hypothetical protein